MAEKPTGSLSKEDRQKIVEGKLGLHKIDESLPGKEAVDARREIVEELTGKKLEAIGAVQLDYDAIKNRNAENVIGGAVIPMGIAGPIKVCGDYANGSFYVPFATTEGALIASINRGAKALTLSGGVQVRVIEDAMARAPVFRLESVKDVKEFLHWLKEHEAQIKEAANATTKHGEMRSIRPFVLGNNVWLRLSYHTGDAMGMNMVTIASEAACAYIEESFEKARFVAVSGNMCSDKKESLVNNLYGRGKSIIADAKIPEKVLSEVFGIDAEQANDTNIRKNLLGSARAGSLKYNGHFANVIAAIFAATGQDLAQVVESSSGYTWTEVRGKELYVSITLPSLEVGTVGGGTGLPTQKEALSMLGVQGPGNPSGRNSLSFAEIIAAAVLAGELNLICALSSRELGRAHSKLGRAKK
ncbi:MAG: hydroxymethylglutaryl-CoA reductase (NADPH) [Candidatus Micrarchaeota archaeon]|nr:hydroxymethylglutaryl-CoA reductase (NADPH) [Candidatus Micrarchaeota archaeon]